MTSIDKEKLVKALNDNVEISSHMEVGSEDHLRATKVVESQAKTYAELIECEAKINAIENEQMIKSAELAEAQIKAEHERKLAVVDRITNVAEKTVTVLGVGALCVAGFHFEQEGAFNNKTFGKLSDWVWKLLKF